MVSDRYDLGLHDGPQGKGVDYNSRPLSDDDNQSTYTSQMEDLSTHPKLRTFKLEVDEKRNIVNALSAPCQFSKDQESAPSLAVGPQAHTLENGGKRFKIALGNASRFDNTPCPNPSVC